MHHRGFLHHVHEDHDLEQQVQAVVQRILTLAPQAARLNKQVLRKLCASGEFSDAQSAAEEKASIPAFGPYFYANGAEHREGIDAFLSKRKPVFQ
jgi:enoyl-CoA hydratase/carnithine racemase